MSAFHDDIVRRLEHYYPGQGWSFSGESPETFSLTWHPANSDPAPTYEDLAALDVPPPRPWAVLKLTIVRRIKVAGGLQNFHDWLAANPLAKIEWDAAVEIDSDDADVRAVLQALGHDPDVILAPEG